jgi:hypothetical protein
MKIRLSIGLAASLIFLCCGQVFSQETMETGGAVPEAHNESEMQWVWGEVVTTDAQNKALTVKFLDYETDQEKEITFSLDDQTSFENARSLDELKPSDAVSIDYAVSADGRNIAKNISVEAPEAVNPQAEQQNPEQVPVIKPEMPVIGGHFPEGLRPLPTDEGMLPPQEETNNEQSN